jgi:D-alanyl-D-alanine carboxypeptidase (penicillin-binding protein 5/6)
MKLLPLALISFVFVATAALALSRETFPLPFLPIKAQSKSLTPIPVLVGTSEVPLLSGESVLAVDLTSGVSLYEKNPDSPLLPASTTKIITALVAMDYYPDDEILTIGSIKIDGQKMGLQPGEKISAKSLLYGLLVYSANDAAEALAQGYPGGRDLFIEAMNIKAKELSLYKTNFKNPSGLDGNTQVTTARDLARVAEIAMQNPRFAQIVGTKQIEVASLDGKIVHKLTNINELLGEVPGIMGVKTGWTENARENLVTYMERDGHQVIITLLGSQDRFGETKEIIEWIFTNYQWQEVTIP